MPSTHARVQCIVVVFLFAMHVHEFIAQMEQCLRKLPHMGRQVGGFVC